MKKILLILSFIFILSGCDPYVYKQPFNYGASVWVCNTPEITYTIEMTYSETDEMDIPVGIAKTIVDEKEIKFELCFLSNTVDAWEYTEENGEIVGDKILFSGTCKYSKTEFIMITQGSVPCVVGVSPLCCT